MLYLIFLRCRCLLPRPAYAQALHYAFMFTFVSPLTLLGAVLISGFMTATITTVTHQSEELFFDEVAHTPHPLTLSLFLAAPPLFSTLSRTRAQRAAWKQEPVLTIAPSRNP